MTSALPAGAAALTGVLVGTGIVATRYVIGESDPASLALLRYLIGLLCLLPAWAVAPKVAIPRRDILPICLLGIVQFGILIVLLNIGLQVVSAGLGALIFATLPLLALMIAAALGQEPVTLAKTAGVLLTIAGVALALGDRLRLSGGGDGFWLGALAVFASAFCGALCSVLYRPYLRRLPPLQVGVLAMLASVVLLCLPAAWEGFFAQPPRLSSGGWLAVGFIGVSSGLGYYLWLWALSHTTATRVTIFQALSPITAGALGALLLDEAETARFLLGLGAVALGLWLAYRHDRP